MSLPFAIAQGAGLATAAGIRPFLPALLAGALASGDVGIDFEGTDYAFLEETWFLLLLFALLTAFIGAERRLGPGALEHGPLGAAVAGLGAGVAALLFAASLADEGEPAWPGLAAGILCAALAQVAVRGLAARVRARLDTEAAAALSFYAEATALALAGLSILFPPLGLVALAFVVWLLVTGRRREGEKYAGLRILR